MRLEMMKGEEMLFCPVCKSRTNPNKAQIKIHYQENIYYPCCPLCQSEFERNPDKYTGQENKRKNKTD
jgi:YHS domain-containing protein